MYSWQTTWQTDQRQKKELPLPRGSARAVIGAGQHLISCLCCMMCNLVPERINAGPAHCSKALLCVTHRTCAGYSCLPDSVASLPRLDH
jgi:hypothetical protein